MEMNLPIRIRELKSYYRGAGRKPLRKKGQNFLVDPAAYETLIEEGALESTDLVLEIGTGSGMLTSLLAEKAGRVLSVEVDSFLFCFSEGFLTSFGNVELFQGDILASKSQLSPHVAGRLQELSGEGWTLKIVSNPPYHISTPLIINLLTAGIPFSRMVFTLQLEIGMKVTASAGSRNYGPISVVSQIFSCPRMVKRVSAGCFWPSPKVDSAIICFQPRDDLKKKIEDFSFFQKVLKALFTQRRKKTSNSIKSLAKSLLISEGWEEKMTELGVSEKRGDELTPLEMIVLSNELRQVP